MVEKTMDKIVALAKSRGFVYPGSEIYGGLANTWDYGNLGVELKNNVKKAWWQKFIQESPYNVGVDCAILMNPQTWIASGHLGVFSDPLWIVKNAMSVSELINLLKITLTSMVLRLETASTAGAMSRWRILLKRIMFHVRLAVNMISQRSVVALL